MHPQGFQDLIQRLAEGLSSAVAEQVVTHLVQGGGQPGAVLTLLDELNEVSGKATDAAIEAMPELDRRGALSHVVSWLDLGVILAERSGATALKYFKDSPLILSVIEPVEAREAVLAIGLEMAEQDANVTLEYLRAAPSILTVVPADQLKLWLEVGVELTEVDVVVGLEYIRQISALAPVLPLSDVRSWLSFGMKLIVPNAIGKPDYIATIAFLRTGPAILSEIESVALRSQVVAVGSLLADRSPEAGSAWLAESPRVLRGLPTFDWRVKVLQYGSLLAEKHAEAALSYLRRSPEIIGLIGVGSQARSRFENWFKTGMEVLAYSPEGAQAYFAMESQRALTSVEEALNGVPLRQVARTLKLFVQGLCGTEMMIAALPDSMTTSPARATVSSDGRTMFLPALLRRFPAAEQNERLYLVMAAHEAGHVEFGTYRLALESLTDLVDSVRQRYGRGGDQGLPDSLASLFRLYPQPRLAQDLWTVLEDARVEFLLRAEYPGLRRDLEQVAAEAVTPRDPAQGLTAKELIVDCLLRLSTGEAEELAVPHALKREVSMLWQLCQPLLSSSAKAEDTIRLVHDLYVRIEELLAPRGAVSGKEQDEDGSKDLGASPKTFESTEAYRPVTNWSYRGDMNPEFIKRDREEDHEAHQGLERTASRGGGSKERSEAGRNDRGGAQDSTSGEVLGGGRSLPSVVEELLALEVHQDPVPELIGHGGRALRYPEWDYSIQDYRRNWCRVVERPAEAGSDESVASALTKFCSSIRSLRRFFETLRPQAFRRVAGQADGEEVDLDHAVKRAVELRAGLEGGDRVYVRHEKNDRNVAVVFLVDVSGSTGRQIESRRRIIDVEKEGLVLLCEALEAVGDQYALYAYSGQDRASVDFLTIKDFDERLGTATAHRLGGLSPRQQNRDGAAIRHAVAKLMAREVKTRILFLLSDGRPLDGEYKDEYALEDTKAALREARRQGVNPFCVTIDREGDSYLRRMYGDVRYTVIDRVEALPEKLPRIYRQLAT